MPFDALPQRPDRSAEIALLDEMAALLADPRDWTQGALAEEYRRWFRTRIRRCLYGAVRFADNGRDEGICTPVAMAVLAKLQSLAAARRLPSVIAFNDSLYTTHAAVLALIAEARAQFVAEMATV